MPSWTRTGRRSPAPVRGALGGAPAWVLLLLSAFAVGSPSAAAAQGTDVDAEERRPSVSTAGTEALSPGPAPTGDAPDDDAEDVVATFGNVVGTDGLQRPTGGESPSHRLAWRDAWPRFSFDEAVLSFGLGALLVAAEALPTASTLPNWRGGLLFDDGVREGMRLRTPESRESARLASEALQWVLIATPFVIDALGTAGIGDGSWDTAFQMGLISLESYVVALVVWKVTTLLARRERPVDAACRADASAPECAERFETTSFFSNQTMNAFTGASLVCLEHAALPLFGDEAADTATCVSSLTAAAVVGLLRVMSDREYLTDALMGAAVGFVAGYVVPWALHYQGGARPELRAPMAAVPFPMVGPNDTYGLSLAGWF
jgi:membrane-associated phospholipid phosphatase